MDNDQKLKVLTDIARELNQSNVTWAVGGSMMLYLRGIASEFHDIDIMATDADADTAKQILLRMGTLEPSHLKPQYKTKTFLEFIIGGVEVDVMAGFAIVKDGVEHDCSLKEEEITDYISIENGRIPLHSLAAWRRYYVLMGKPEKVWLIDQAAQ